MSVSRRVFCKKGGLAVASVLAGGLSPLFAEAKEDLVKLTILHTNDTHSRIKPFPNNHKRYAGLGGFAKRATIINSIREKEEHILLLDAGDVFQGTPYFNFYHGELEFKLMTAMKYDAITLGNHDFDAGLDGLQKQLPHAGFDILSANYDFMSTPLNGVFKPYKVFKRGKLRIGVFGLGIELDGLVPPAWYGKVTYKEPIAIANNVANKLKHEEDCDLVICLSHLGYKYASNKVSDVVLAKQTKNIDLIIGGHTHSFFDEPVVENNALGEQVIVNQVGWAGLYLGRIDFYFLKHKRKKEIISTPVIIGK